jgi:hypothetical protein
MLLRTLGAIAPNTSIERTVTGKPVTAAHVERWTIECRDV